MLQVKWSGVKTQQSTTPFIDDMYGHLRETLNDYEVIICRWPEYVLALENVSTNSMIYLHCLIFLVIFFKKIRK